MTKKFEINGPLQKTAFRQELVSQRHLLYLSLFSAFAVVYASILPVEFVSLPFSAAVETFGSIPWLDLGVSRRADWVANGLVMLPFGFFAAGAADTFSRNTGAYAARLMLIALAGMLLVIAIEFLQIWFPQRTLSQNDIAAGMVGALLGPLLWPLLGRPLCTSLPKTQRPASSPSLPQSLASWLLGVFCVSLLLYSILPVDLMLRREEWQAKLEAGRFCWIAFTETPKAAPSNTDMMYSLLVSAARMIPLGFLAHRSLTRQRAVLLLLIMPITIEILQAPVFSRYTTFADVLCGWCGGLAGLLLAEHRQKVLALNQRLSFKLTIFAGTLTATIFLFLGHAKRIATPNEIARDWSNFYSPPFAKYYWMDEFQAGSNAAAKLMAFAAIGFLAANLRATTKVEEKRSTAWTFVLWTTILAAAAGIELAQIYLHPFIGDASDIILYSLGGWIGWISYNAVTGSASSSLPQEKGAENF